MDPSWDMTIFWPQLCDLSTQRGVQGAARWCAQTFSKSTSETWASNFPRKTSNERTHSPHGPRKKPWVSNSPSNFLRGPLGFGPIQFLDGNLKRPGSCVKDGIRGLGGNHIIFSLPQGSAGKSPMEGWKNLYRRGVLVLKMTPGQNEGFSDT